MRSFANNTFVVTIFFFFQLSLGNIKVSSIMDESNEHKVSKQPVIEGAIGCLVKARPGTAVVLMWHYHSSYLKERLEEEC